ncbi:amidase family protein [Actinomadura madurae]|uniref:amidase family protein n=1 Tax=Actinomadura madurae TaxID=1993 RepID=UPI00355747B9
MYPLAPSLDHVGVFAATSEDALIGHQALADRPVLPDAALDRVSVGWIPPESIAVTDRRIEELTRRFVSRAFDVDVVEGFAKWDLFDVLSTLQGREAFQVHEHHLAADEDLIDPEVRARLDRGREISDRLYAEADEVRRELRAVVGELLSTFDVLALPTVPIVAPPLDARSVTVDGTGLEVRAALLSLTSPWNLTGSPAISVPAGPAGRAADRRAARHVTGQRGAAVRRGPGARRPAALGRLIRRESHAIHPGRPAAGRGRGRQAGVRTARRRHLRGDHAGRHGSAHRLDPRPRTRRGVALPRVRPAHTLRADHVRHPEGPPARDQGSAGPVSHRRLRRGLRP